MVVADPPCWSSPLGLLEKLEDALDRKDTHQRDQARWQVWYSGFQNSEGQERLDLEPRTPDYSV